MNESTGLRGFYVDVEGELITLKFPDHVDSTQLSLWSSCPQKWFLEFCLGRRQGAKSIHLHAGGAFAEGMEWVRRMHFEGLNREEALEVGFRKYAEFWGDYPMLLDENKSFVNMWMALEAYLEKWPLDEKGQVYEIATTPQGDPWVEFSFAIPIAVNDPVTNQPILFSGRCDAMVKTPTGKTIFPLDDKTTQQMGPSWTNSWAMRGQLHGYTWASRQMGFECGGAIVRGVSLLKNSFGTQEVPIMLSTAQTDEWYLNSIPKIQQMRQSFLRCVEAFQKYAAGMEQVDFAQLLHVCHHFFPKAYADGCTNYGGCAYQSVCSNPRPWELYKDYDVYRWNPLAKDPTAESEDRLAKQPPMDDQPELAAFMRKKGLA
jgi:hypothetical protein